MFTAVILLNKSEINAQISLPEDNFCQPSAEEILSVIKSAYDLSPTSEGVIIAGEIRTSRLIIEKSPVLTTRPYEPLLLTQILAASGGTFRTAKHPFYLIRESVEEKTKIKLEIDLRHIKQGRVKDIAIEKGDVIYISRGCIYGKLLPPTKPTNPREPIWTDYPNGFPNQRIAR